MPAFEAAFEKLRGDLEGLASGIEAYSSGTTASVQSLDRNLTLVMLGVSVISVLLLTLGNWKAARHILNPIDRMRESLRQVAAGISRSASARSPAMTTSEPSLMISTR